MNRTFMNPTRRNRSYHTPRSLALSLAILLAASTTIPAAQAGGPRDFARPSQQKSDIRVQRLGYDERDRAQNAGIAYDANDSTAQSNNGTRYTYDAAQRLIRSVSPDQPPITVDYFYDGLGQLVRTTTNGVVSDYVLDESGDLPRVIGEITASKETLYAYGPEGLHAIRTVEGSTQRTDYALNDGLGSLKGLADSAGTLVTTQTFDAWGNPRYQNGPIPNLGYTGEPTFADGSIHLRARSYLPSQGRFLQRDSFAGFSGNGQSQNRYAYAEGNPVNATDPSGHVPIVSSKGLGSDIQRGIDLAGQQVMDPTAVARNLQNESIATAVATAIASGLISGQYGQGMGMGLGARGSSGVGPTATRPGSGKVTVHTGPVPGNLRSAGIDAGAITGGAQARLPGSSAITQRALISTQIKTRMLAEEAFSTKIPRPSNADVAYAWGRDISSGMCLDAVNLRRSRALGHAERLMARITNPDLARLLNEMPDDLFNAYPTTIGPGTHAEIQVLNGLLDRGAKLENIEIFVIRPKTGEPFVMCPHCSYLAPDGAALTGKTGIGPDGNKVEVPFEPHW